MLTVAGLGFDEAVFAHRSPAGGAHAAFSFNGDKGESWWGPYYQKDAGPSWSFLGWAKSPCANPLRFQGLSGRWSPRKTASPIRFQTLSPSWVVLDRSLMQSVSGGGHFGGGLFVSAYDMGRFGYLTLHHGKWKDRQLLSNQWVDWALTPTKPEPTYGFMNWFLNTDKKLWPSAPASAFAHMGNGTNMIYVDPNHDLVAVVRWIDNRVIDGFLKRLLAAIYQG